MGSFVIRACPRSLVYGLLLTSVVGCKRPEKSPVAAVPATVVSKPPTLAPSAAPAVAVPAPPSAAPAADRAIRCTARTTNEFHLRPTDREKSAGPSLPAGTNLTVLAPTERTRGRTRLYKVEVAGGGPRGYAFLSLKELALTCPLVWPTDALTKPNQPRQDDLEMAQCFHKGVFKQRAQVFDLDCFGTPTRAADIKALYKLDLDGDGRQDELIALEEAAQPEFALLFNTAKGWRAFYVDREHKDSYEMGWNKPVRAGDATYLVFANACSYEGETKDDSEIFLAYSVLRVDAAGRVFTVLDVVKEETADWEFRGEADGGITLRDQQGRTQRLRWDSALYRLVP